MFDAKNKRAIGSHYESRVAAFLKKQGFEILEQNYHCRFGEIDLIARDTAELVFIEVKYRSTDRAGSALEAITEKKAAQVRHVAAVYLAQKRYSEQTPVRFDAVGIDGERITYIKNAF